MRSLASAEAGAGTASAAGGPAAGADAPDATATSATPAAARNALAERVTRLGVEEVHRGDVDRDRHLVLQPKHHVSRELRNEVRTRRDDALLARGLLFLLVFVLPLTHRGRVDVEVHDRLA